MTLSVAYPTLCLVTDRSYSRTTPLTVTVEEALKGGVNMVQLREKDLPAGALLSLAVALREATRRHSALLMVNDRLDVALVAEADGVQLGEDALPVSAARRIAGKRMLIGRSVHSIDGGREAEAQDADFLVVGTIFPTTSHPGAPPAGLGLLRQVAQAVKMPFLAIGGIDSTNAAQVMAQGAAGVAVVTAIMSASDPRQAATGLKGVLTMAASAQKVVTSN